MEMAATPTGGPGGLSPVLHSTAVENGLLAHDVIARTLMEYTAEDRGNTGQSMADRAGSNPVLGGTHHHTPHHKCTVQATGHQWCMFGGTFPAGGTSSHLCPTIQHTACATLQDKQPHWSPVNAVSPSSTTLCSPGWTILDIWSCPGASYRTS